ncbi:MAG: aminotransferase class IV [Acidobacteria bacterium]|nr:aminotransferase class IV [Acidobacteriota bacterium]
MRLEDGRVVRLDRHLARMGGSARAFGCAWDEARVRTAVETARAGHPARCWRLRLVVDRHGEPDVTCTRHDTTQGTPWRVALASSPIDDRDPFLFHKTTNRAMYDAARAARPDADEVLLWNQRGEITEATIANVVAELDGVRVTPPVSSGLLPGVCRAELLEAGLLRERVLTKDDFVRASRIWLINSLRGWIPATLVP